MSEGAANARVCRFWLFPQNLEVSFECRDDTRLSDVKARLCEAFSTRRADLEHWSQLRLIQGGSEIRTDEQLANQVTQNSHSALTIHVVVKPRPVTETSLPQIVPRGSSPHHDTGSTSPMAAESPPPHGPFSPSLASSRLPVGNEIGMAIAQALVSAPVSALGPDYESDDRSSGSGPEGMSEDFLEGFTDEQAQEYFAEWESSVHFHGTFFDEDEADLVGQAFTKHVREEARGDDSAISYASVHKFLWTYFTWGQKAKLRPADVAFPDRFFKKLVRRVVRVPSGTRLSRDTLVTLSDLREIFFLFDNETPVEELCEHGAFDRVRAACIQLHQQLMGEDVKFSEEIFSMSFERATGLSPLWEEGSLSCQGVELAYFLYCVGITREHPDVGGNRHNSQDSVARRRAGEQALERQQASRA